MKMFKDPKTFKFFKMLTEEMGIDERQRFSLEVRRLYDKKITSERELDSYYITITDLSILAHKSN